MAEGENIYRVCKGCNNSFYIAPRDAAFFESKQLDLPKYCWKCRQIRKNERNQALGIITDTGTKNEEKK